MHQKSNLPHDKLIRGRGAQSNDVSRFEKQRRERFDDGWERFEELTPLKREIISDNTKTILAKNTSPDVGFDRSINPYRGCEHGCIYCFARPTHSYLGYSAGLDFETKIHIKPKAVSLLAKELSKPSYQCQAIALGTNTDPWQPIEKDQEITRDLLKYLLKRRHPIGIVTKGALINRDIDLLAQFAELDLVHVYVSVTTLDNTLHRKMEPRAMSPTKRLQTIRNLRNSGIPAGVICAPMIPRLNDMELEDILAESKEAGAQVASYILIRLPLEVSPLFREWLDEHYPDRASKIMSHINQTRNGQDNSSEFFDRQRGSGVYAQLLKRRFEIAHSRLKFDEKLIPLRTDLFRPSPSDYRQLELF